MKGNVERFIKVSAWVTVIVFVVRSFCEWETLVSAASWEVVSGIASDSIAITAALMLAYERWLWRIIRIHGVPVLCRKYTGIVRPNCDKKDRKAIIRIKQTLLSVRVFLKTTESESSAVSATIEEVNGEKYLVYTYLNTPKAEYRTGSPIHYGTAMLKVENPKRLEGFYFTSRETTGDMLKFQSVK